RLACAVAATTSSLEATEFFCALSTVVSIRCGPGDGRRKTAPRARAGKIRIARSPAPPGSRAQRWPSAGLSDGGDIALQSSHQLERVGKKLRPAEIARFECKQHFAISCADGAQDRHTCRDLCDTERAGHAP